MGVLKTIAIVMLIIYGLRIIGRLLAPWMAKQASKKMQKLAEEQMKRRGFNNQNQPQRPEGTVTVENLKSKGKSQNKTSEGEYTDYEIVD